MNIIIKRYQYYSDVVMTCYGFVIPRKAYPIYSIVYCDMVMLGYDNDNF